MLLIDNIPSFPNHFQPANAALLKSDKLCQSLALDGQRGRKQLLRAWRPINPPFLEIRKGRPFQDNNKFLIVTLIMVFALTNEEIDSSMCCTFFAPLEGPAGSLWCLLPFCHKSPSNKQQAFSPPLLNFLQSKICALLLFIIIIIRSADALCSLTIIVY